MYQKIKILILLGAVVVESCLASSNTIRNDDPLTVINNFSLGEVNTTSGNVNLMGKSYGYHLFSNAIETTPEFNEQATLSSFEWMKKFCPFVTHSLIVLPEDVVGQVDTMKVIKPLFSSRLWVLFSSTVLDELHKDASGYYFFALPNALKSQGAAFILGIPGEFLGDNFIKTYKKKKTVSSWEVTDLEKKLGLRIEHLDCLGVIDDFKKDKLSLVAQTSKKLVENLNSIFKVLFVARNFYTDKQEIPRWILVFDGHGKASQLCTDVSSLKKGNLIKKCGKLARLKPEHLADIINEVAQSIRLMQIHFLTCWGGVLPLSKLVNAVQSNEPIFTSMVFTGDRVIHAATRVNQYKDFLNAICAFRIKEKWGLETPQLRSAFVDTFTKAVQNLSWKPSIPCNIKKYASKTTVFGYNVPVIKLPGEPFKPVSCGNSAKIWQNKLVNGNALRSKSVQKDEIVSGETVFLCDGNPIETIVAKDFEGKEGDQRKIVAYPYFASGIPGDLFQCIHELKVPERFKKLADVLEAFFPEIFKKKFQKQWAIQIKHVMHGEKDLGSIYVSSNGKKVRALFLRMDTWYYTKKQGTKGKRLVKKCAMKEKNYFVSEWLKVFQQEKDIRQKQAQLTRDFLKDAVNKALPEKKSWSSEDDLSDEDKNVECVVAYPKFP